MGRNLVKFNFSRPTNWPRKLTVDTCALRCGYHIAVDKVLYRLNYKELHGWKVISFFGTLVGKDWLCRHQDSLTLQNLQLFVLLFFKFLWPIDLVRTQTNQNQDWLFLQLNQQPIFPWPTPKVKHWSLSGNPLLHHVLNWVAVVTDLLYSLVYGDFSNLWQVLPKFR